MAAPAGEKIFSKKMTKTDLERRLHWPSEFLRELPDFNGAHQVEFSAKDKGGKVFRFRCYKRMNSPYHKTVVSAGWASFTRTKPNIRPGDDVTFYTSDDPDVHFNIRFNHKVMLFDQNINDEQD